MNDLGVAEREGGRRAPASACPTCGAPAERGQLICLECGSRIALSYRRPPSWRVPAAIVSIVLLLAGAGFVLALRALDDDAKDEVAAQPAGGGKTQGDDDDNPGGGAKGDADGQSDREEQNRDREEDGREERERQQDEDERAGNDAGDDEAAGGTEDLPAGPGGVPTWPEGEDGFTVVILSSEDRRSAAAFAREAGNAGVEAGVLRADDYPALSASTGFFIVFVGRYANQAGADRAAARLGRRYNGAYPQLVDGSKSRRRG